MQKIHRLPLLLFSLLFFYACKDSIRTPEFLDVDEIKLHSLGLKASELRLQLRFMNPNTFPLELKNADLDITLDGRPLGKTVLDTLILIPAKDSFLVPIRMQVEMKSLFPNLLSLALKDEVELGVEGHVKVKRSGIGLNIPVHYRGKQKISL